MSTAVENETPPLPPTELALEVPKEVSALATGADAFVAIAEEFVVDNEPAFQVADEVQARLKAEAKAIDEKRLEFTRPIDAIKKKWMDWFKPAVEGRNEAARIYQTKMSAFRRQEREKAEKAQREAELRLAEQRRAEEEAARKLEEKAARLKSEQAKQKALAEAEQRRQTAQMIPTSVALSAPAPQTVASNVAEIWEAEIEDTAAFLGWLISRPEWLGVLKFQTAEMNRLAKQCQNVVKVPGVKFSQRDSYRSKPR